MIFLIMNINRDYFLKLTTSLYQVTDCFPEEEPLRFSLRRKATDILEALSFTNPEVTRSQLKAVSQDIKAMDSLLQLAQSQDWVDEVNLQVLRKAYRRVKSKLERSQNEKIDLKELRTRDTKEIQKKERSSTEQREQEQKPEKQLKESEQDKSENMKEKLSRRHQEILRVLRNNPRATVSVINRELPGVSKRTVRRDLKRLLKKNLITRKGEGVNTFYQIRAVDNL